MNADKAKSLLSVHGSCVPQKKELWTGDIELPSDIEEFYLKVGPMDISIDTGANPIFIPCLSNLWKHQAGYRWNGLTGEKIEDWNPEWIVVADEGADPYVFYRGKILFAYHGEGEWEFNEEYPDIFTMAGSLAEKTYDFDEDD